jgi:hypothetical protein
MPLLDITDVLCDPDIASYLVITRRSVVTGNNGLQAITPFMINPQPIGVIVPQKDAPIFRGPDQQNLPRLLQVYTKFMLQGPAQKQPTEPGPLPLPSPRSSLGGSLELDLL